MAKRIVICSDGTGNSAIKGRGTNVFKLFEAVDLETHKFNPDATPQIAIYDDGVGTETFKPLKILSGATGWGLSRNVKHLYKELARIYDPGDDIYMFGFSRGAFTVRTLVGFIQTCGLVDPERLQPKTFRTLQQAVDKGYKAYRKCYRPKLWRMLFGARAGANGAFKREHSLPYDIPIRFLGVWDTVDAVGLPFRLSDAINATFYQFKFSDHKLSPLVQRAAQALAIDEPRESFAPLLWEEDAQDRARIQQVWFAGAHSNIGGGYPKQGMSLVALDWLLSEAERPLDASCPQASSRPGAKACGSAPANDDRFASMRAWTTSSTIHGRAQACSTMENSRHRRAVFGQQRHAEGARERARTHCPRNRRLLAGQSPGQCRRRLHSAARGRRQCAGGEPGQGDASRDYHDTQSHAAQSRATAAAPRESFLLSVPGVVHRRPVRVPPCIHRGWASHARLQR